MDCKDKWFWLEAWINDLGTRVETTDTMGDKRLERWRRRLLKELDYLLRDLYAWDPGECFSFHEFEVKLARIEKELQAINKRIEKLARVLA